MAEYVKKSDVLELLSLPKDLIAEYVCDLKGLWIDDDEAEQTEPQIDDFFREPTAEERKAVAEYIESISIPTGVNVFDFMDEPQTEKE